MTATDELRTAVDAKDSRAAKAALRAGADPNSLDADRQPLLRAAIRSKSKPITRALLGAGADVSRPSDDGGRALHWLARWMRDPAIAEATLERGAAIDARDQQGRTALRVAVEFNRTPFAELLVERGADINAVDDHSASTPLLHLLSAPRPTKGARATAAWLVEIGAALDVVNGRGYTALHYAARIGDIDLTRRLLAAGARYQKTESGGPLVHCMDSRGYSEELWELLLEAGADLDEVYGNENLLMVAGFANNVKGIRWLVRCGADTTLEVEGRTARERMASLGYMDCARALG